MRIKNMLEWFISLWFVMLMASYPTLFAGDGTMKLEGIFYFDNQVNGYLSYSFSRAGLTVEKVGIVTESFWHKGITTYIPTLTTESHERLIENFG